MKLSPRITLLVIAAMFLLPLLLAWFMYSGTIEYKPAATRNLGNLVKPPVPLTWTDTRLISADGEPFGLTSEVFEEHWVILYPVGNNCAQNCLDEITALRQIHRASGRHQSRILIALLMQEPENREMRDMLDEIYSSFYLLEDASGKTAEVLDQAATADSAVYLIDPLGNIMMTYDSGSDPNHLKQDLKRLLTWSKLDEQ